MNQCKHGKIKNQIASKRFFKTIDQVRISQDVLNSSLFNSVELVPLDQSLVKV